MLKRVNISQECAQFFMLNYQYLHALLRSQDQNAIIFQNRLAKYTADQIDTYWSELYDEYNHVRGKEDHRHIQKTQTGMVRDGR